MTAEITNMKPASTEIIMVPGSSRACRIAISFERQRRYAIPQRAAARNPNATEIKRPACCDASFVEN